MKTNEEIKIELEFRQRLLKDQLDKNILQTEIFYTMGKIAALRWSLDIINPEELVNPIKVIKFEEDLKQTEKNESFSILGNDSHFIRGEEECFSLGEIVKVTAPNTSFNAELVSMSYRESSKVSLVLFIDLEDDFNEFIAIETNSNDLEMLRTIYPFLYKFKRC